MAFKFRLKPLLRHREFKFRESQTAFASAESKRIRIVDDIEELREKIRSEGLKFEHEQETGIETPRYLYFRAYLDNLDRELLKLYKELEKAAREAEARQIEMIECDKEVKVLESIETRDREAYNYQVSRAEQKKLDESAIIKGFRNRDGRGEK